MSHLLILTWALNPSQEGTRIIASSSYLGNNIYLSEELLHRLLCEYSMYSMEKMTSSRNNSCTPKLSLLNRTEEKSAEPHTVSWQAVNSPQGRVEGLGWTLGYNLFFSYGAMVGPLGSHPVPGHSKLFMRKDCPKRIEAALSGTPSTAAKLSTPHENSVCCTVGTGNSLLSLYYFPSSQSGDQHEDQ